MAKQEQQEKKLTGKHVLIWILSFFGVMFIANGFFVYYANTSWPGVEVESPYKEGQIYDQKLAEAKAQEERGWHLDANLKRSRGEVFLVVEAKDKSGNPLLDLAIEAEVGRAITEVNDQKINLESKGNGIYQGKLTSLDPGRWRVKLEVFEKNELMFKSVGQTTLE